VHQGIWKPVPSHPQQQQQLLVMLHHPPPHLTMANCRSRHATQPATRRRKHPPSSPTPLRHPRSRSTEKHRQGPRRQRKSARRFSHLSPHARTREKWNHSTRATPRPSSVS
jgi:hypothetical protein